ncbi:MAG: hypothetical protein HQL56_03460 [Magnetococcales bacterium]|nr:hypothetical protein [Magnetococcales bacterium]
MNETPEREEVAAPPVGFPESGETRNKRLIGLRIHDSCMVFRLAVNDPRIVQGDQLLVETRRGETVGHVMYVAEGLSAQEAAERLHPGCVVRIVRRLTRRDREAQNGGGEKERQAKQICREAIRELGLEMRLARVTYFSAGNKAIFYFTAENRVDFRELVKRIVAEMHIRVEMRQIGVRDESRLLGGIGMCGQVLCCNAHLQSFHTVSVRMAKNQEMALNPDAISGLCGRLMCCLAYENDAYNQLRKELPPPGSRFSTEDGREGVIKSVNPVRKSADVVCSTGEKATLALSEMTILDGAAPVVVNGVAEGEGGDPKPVAALPPRGGRAPAAGHPPSPRRERPGGERKRAETPPRVAAPPPPAAEKAAQPQPAEGEAPAARKRRRRRRRSGDGNTPPTEGQPT